MNMPDPVLTEEEVNKIAQGIFDGSIFTNAHLADPNDAQVQCLVFIGLSFEDEESVKEKADHTLIYQYLEKKTGMSPPIGKDKRQYPTFMTFETCNRSDHSRVIDRYRELTEAGEATAH